MASGDFLDSKLAFGARAHRIDVPVIWIVASIEVNFPVANCSIARLFPFGILRRRRLSHLYVRLPIPQRFSVCIFCAALEGPQ